MKTENDYINLIRLLAVLWLIFCTILVQISTAQDTTKTKIEIFFPDTALVVSNAPHDKGEYIWFGIGTAKLKLRKGEEIHFRVFSGSEPCDGTEHVLKPTPRRREYYYYDEKQLKQ
jgi:hypothetical protein